MGTFAPSAFRQPVFEPYRIPECAEFYSDFQHLTDIEHFEVSGAGGTWQIRSDTDVVGQAGVLCQSNSALDDCRFLVRDMPPWPRNFEVECRIKYIAVGVGVWQSGAHMFRVEDDNHYHFQTRLDANFCYLFERFAGAWTMLANATFTCTLATWYILKSIVEGWNSRHLIGGVLYVPAVGWQDLTGHNIPSGRFGLRTGNVHAHYSYILVRRR
jgi:hypothetical protein